jgi:hypothetical protein
MTTKDSSSFEIERLSEQNFNTRKSLLTILIDESAAIVENEFNMKYVLVFIVIYISLASYA